MNPASSGARSFMLQMWRWMSWTAASVAALSMACDPDSKSAGVVTATEGQTSSAEGGDDSGAEGGGSCEAIVSADDFDRSCDQHEDCIMVFEGPSTDACRECAWSAVNVDDHEQYLATLGPLSCSAAECDADCTAAPGAQGVCIDGLCNAGRTFGCGDTLCGADTQFCAFFGSDIDEEPGSSVCYPLPESCDANAECGCLLDSDEFNVQFCLDEGSCQANEGVFSISCPGG